MCHLEDFKVDWSRRTAYDIVAEADAAFDAWCVERAAEIEGLTLLEQIDLYADRDKTPR